MSEAKTGAAAPATITVIGGTDGTTARALKVNSAGALVGNVGSSVGDGFKLVTTAGTRVQLATATAIVSVAVQAKSTNTGTIMVGGSTVVAAVGGTASGIRLSAGQSVSIDTDDLSDVWLDATVNGEGVTYVYTVA